ncbi:MAG: RNA ligase partner protein [Methylohalobius sp. ZOD2]
MDSFVLDTSIFTNPDVYGQFGESPKAAMDAFLHLARRSGVRLYMPSSVYDELCLIKGDDIPPEFEAVVRIRSPRRFNMMVPAGILYEFIEEVRARIDRGLRIAEEHAKMVWDRVEPEGRGKVINRLRGRYREALRQGIIDSREDMDVLLLAYEMDGILLSADQGLRKWADKVGVKIIRPDHLLQVMETLVEYGG